MDDKPRALHEAFPEHADRIKRLMETDPYFRQRADEYHELSRAAHRAQMAEEPVEEVELSEIRKHRDLARDELFRLILL
jgi:uncharacterized protein YdcH (DUF465 family)